MPRLEPQGRAFILLAAAVAIAGYAAIWLWFQPIVFSTTKTDFSCFYRAGRMVMAGDGSRVYDLAAQRTYDQRLGTSFVLQGRQFSLPFVFPPYTLVLFAPLSRLPYRAAELLWFAANAGMLLALPFVLRKSLRSGSTSIATQLLAPVFFLPAVLALMQGQPSILLLLLLAMAFAAFDAGNETAAGVILACATFKPQLVLPMFVALILWRKWKALVATFWTAVALSVVSAMIVGWRTALHYPRALLEFNHLSSTFGGEHPESMPTLRGMLHVLAPEGSGIAIAGITFALSVALLLLFAVALKRSAAISATSYSLAIAVSCLLSYHAYLHDDSLLLLPIILIGQHLFDNHWSPTHTALVLTIAALYLVPVLPTSLSTTAMQMFAAMAMLAALLAIEIRGSAGGELRGQHPHPSAIPAFHP